MSKVITALSLEEKQILNFLNARGDFASRKQISVGLYNEADSIYLSEETLKKLVEDGYLVESPSGFLLTELGDQVCNNF